ncbi:calexcitin-2-like [Liolophura sinensis]|uniref:calexcitin-2-like n=1 Tax=Liolophura sinensis TaxID=3198878 RepID=UPI00315862B8
MSSGSLHPYLALKYEHMFYLIYDTMKDGNLSRQDFSKLLTRLAEVKGLEPKTKEYRELQERVNGVWAGLMKGSRFYRHNPSQLHLNITEWLEYWKDFARAAKQCEGWPDTSIDGHVEYLWQRDFVDLVFDIMDKDGDNVVSRDDYVRLMAGLGLEKEASSEAYDVITRAKNNSQRLKREEFSDLWLAYLTNENPKSHPGNCIMGILELDPRS